jgi:hypothetical protein
MFSRKPLAKMPSSMARISGSPPHVVRDGGHENVFGGAEGFEFGEDVGGALPCFRDRATTFGSVFAVGAEFGFADGFARWFIAGERRLYVGNIEHSQNSFRGGISSLPDSSGPAQRDFASCGVSGSESLKDLLKSL